MKYFLLMLCLLCCYSLNGQVFFQKIYRTSLSGAFFSCNNVFKTDSGGYIISGNKGFSMGGVHAALVKIDSLGNHVWDKVYESVDGYTTTASMIQDGDSSYIMACCRSFGDDRLTLIKTNSEGEIMWSTIYIDSTHEIYPSKIQKSSDGNFILLFDRILGGIGDAGMLKFDGSGNILWSHIYPDTYCGDFIVFDNGEIVLGNIYGGAALPFYTALIKIDANGNFLWRKGYNFPHSSTGARFPICKTSDNSILIAPRTDSTDAGNAINALVKLDSAGDVLWSYNYLGSGNLNVIKLLPDGGFLLGGSYANDALVYSVDSIGNIEMSKVYGDGSHYENLQDIVMDSDKGFLMISNRDSTVWPSTSNINIVKADSTGYSGCNEALRSMVKTTYTTTSWNLGLVVDTLALTPDSISFNIMSDGNMSTICESIGIEEQFFSPVVIYPNPTTGLFKLEFNGTVLKIQIFNMLGEIVLHEEASGKNEIQIDISKNPPGIYFVRISSGEKIFSRKVIKQ